MCIGELSFHCLERASLAPCGFDLSALTFTASNAAAMPCSSQHDLRSLAGVP